MEQDYPRPNRGGQPGALPKWLIILLVIGAGSMILGGIAMGYFAYQNHQALQKTIKDISDDR